MEVLEIVSEKSESTPWANLRRAQFPRVAIHLLRLLGVVDVPKQRLSEMICTDAIFARELLVVANSPLFSQGIRTKNVHEAIARMGSRNIQALCLTVAARTCLGKLQSVPVMRAIWNHNLAGALIAEQLSSYFGINKEDAYSAGILHDIGRLAMAAAKPVEYAALLGSFSGSAKSMLEEEWKLFGFDHCEAGRLLIESWQLPNDFDSIVAQHHASCAKKETWGMTDLIRMSCKMASAAGFAAFRGCQGVSYSELLNELPSRVSGNFHVSLERLSSDIGRKIQSVAVL